MEIPLSLKFCPIHPPLKLKGANIAMAILEKVDRVVNLLGHRYYFWWPTLYVMANAGLLKKGWFAPWVQARRDRENPLI